MKIYKLVLVVFLFFSANLSVAATSEILAVVEEKAGRVDFYDANTKTLLGGSKVGSLPHEIALSNDRKLAFISNFGISVIDLETFEEKYTLTTGYKNAPHGVKVRPKHPDELYVNTEIDNQILIYELNTKQIKKRFSATPNTHNFIFSPNGEWLWLMSGKNGVTKLNAETGAVLAQYQSPSPIRGLNYTSNENSLMLSGKNEILFLDPISMQITKKIENLNVDQILYSIMTPDSKYILAPAVWNNEVLIIDTKNDKVIKRIVTGLDPINISISSDSQFAFVSNGRSSHISKINLLNFTQEEIDAQPGTNGIALFSKNMDKAIEKPKTKEIFSIGSLLPLTGEKMLIGRDLMLGYEFLRDYINQQGGVKIGNKSYRLIINYIDTQSKETNLLSLVDELQNEYHIKALLDYYIKNSIQSSDLKQLALIPFFVKLDQYDQIEPFLFGNFKNLDKVKETFADSLNLTLTENNLRSYLSLSFLNHSLNKNLFLTDVKNSAGIVLLHTSAGIKDWDYDWANLLKKQGYNVFIPDSFTSRGYIDRKSIGWDKAYQAQLDDLNYAYQILVNIGETEKNRIGLVGYSLGGYSALKAMEVVKDQNPDNVMFKLAASFYGHAHRFTQTNFHKKIALFWGDDDDRAPLEGALTLIKNSKQSDIQLFHYAGGKHGFDNAYLPESVELSDEEGKIYHLGYNKKAQQQSINDLFDFLHLL